jgi:carboxylate-amine ligase
MITTGPYDEAYMPDGTPRPHYAAVLEALAGRDLEALRARLDGRLAERGITFGTGADAEPFKLDPVPRVIPAGEWARIERGLVQRVRALNAFVTDVYSEQAAVEAGVVPARVIGSASYFEPALMGSVIPHARPIVVAGFDVIRNEAGEYLVLEDNVRTPSGVAYAVAARAALDEVLPAPAGRVALDASFSALGAALRALATVEDPTVAVLSDGPANTAYYEHRTIAEALGVPVVTPDDLELRDGRVLAAGRPVDVLYRRTNADRCEDPVGRLLLQPCRSGAVACANAFGTGVADDKLTHAYVEDLVRFYLGEEPLIGSVGTYDLAREDHRERVLGRIDELVVKPRAESGGEGVFVGPHATPSDRQRMVRTVMAAPDDYIAQETIGLSLHPTVAGGELVRRHVDLRAFVFATADGPVAFPGGLTRVALEPGSLVVNSSQDGGGKDTWIL